MKLTLNGESTDLPGERATVADLVKHLQLDRSPVAVEVNRRLVPRGEHDQHALREGDAVEVVTLVGGG